MNNLSNVNNPYNDDKVIAACSIFGVMDTSGACFSGEGIIRAIANMHVRGNGLGGGFAAYGIYPDHPEHYAFHIMYDDNSAKQATEEFIEHHFDNDFSELVPTYHSPKIHDAPTIWRYFLKPGRCKPRSQADDDYVVERVMFINTQIDGSYVFSSGKNMGVFKGVGYPEDIGIYFGLDRYNAYIWTAHGRFPTNTRGWWGGAHPFNILDWTVVHNGEISSYGTNKRYLEERGYTCTMHTDTEVVAYAVDMLMRRHGLPTEVLANIFAPPFWEHIDRMSPPERELQCSLRQVYGGLLLNGPFTVILAHEGEMIGLTDRVRLRPLTVGNKGNKLYLSSEESAIRLIEPNLDKAWIPTGGQPVIGRLNEKKPAPVGQRM